MARLNPNVQIYAYEPGPENADLMQINLLSNPGLKDRINVLRKAVSGFGGKAQWSFDSDNPGASGLYHDGSHKLEVELVSLGQVLEEAGTRKAFVKMDIEGSEYDVIRDTADSVWNQVCGFAFELHDDPNNMATRADFLVRVEALGFRVEKEDVISYFAHRG